MILMLRSMIFIGNSTLSGRSSKKPSLEVYPRKRARHAILKYGNACVLSSGGGSAQVKTWCGNHRWHGEEKLRKSCGCPFSGWSHGRVVIHKVDGPFFWRGFQWKKRSSLWRNTHFHHFRGPATLPPGCFSCWEHWGSPGLPLHFA